MINIVMASEEHSDSEEEILVYAEFNESVNIEKYRNFHVLGIDGRNPIIQADNTFFTGKFENPLGTYMFFEEDPSAQSADPLFDKLPEKNVKYLLKTNKLMHVDHAYVMPRAHEEPDSKRESEEISDLQEIKFTSVDEALTKFRTVLRPDCESSETNSQVATMKLEKKYPEQNMDT